MHTLRKGLDLPLAGAPAPDVEDAAPSARVALVAADCVGVKPSLLVAPGDRVLRGTPLFADKRFPGVRYTSPAAGTVAAVHRGERRALLSVVIDVGDDDGPAAQLAFPSRAGVDVRQPGADGVRALLLESGLWTALRARPFGHVADPAATPRAIFVTAIDTRPHAPPIARLLAGREQEFGAGVSALARLTEGTVFVCVAPEAGIAVPDDPRVRLETFAGPHPAGLPGTHMHLLAPVTAGRAAWYIGCQDVVAIGRLLLAGELDVARVVALAGPGVLRPRLLRTRIGADLGALTRGELAPGEQRVISGSVLDGRIARGEVEGFLGRYHQQVSALPEPREREMFGWIMPGRDKFSVWKVVLGALGRQPLALTTTTNGGPRAMVPIGSYERVMPLDILPTFLLRALVMGDDERAEALGALELEEEDLALCTLVSPGKTEYGPLLRQALTRMEKEAG
jgi:Na+-transporting NADH:ubiquinone oxidoreductase subunit A